MTSTSTLPNYRYANLEGDQIRIFTLLAANREDPLRFRLESHPLHPLPLYYALSYCWGEGEAVPKCTCEDERTGEILQLTSNLEQALRTIRAPNVDTPLWIDQICINQQNQQEKPHQIRLMADIYSRAFMVVIWLGEADEDTSLVWSLLKNVGDQIIRLGKEGKASGERHELYGIDQNSISFSLELGQADDPSWIAFRKIFKRPWFSRVWVFQEVVLSQAAALVCGNNSIAWSMFLQVCCSVNIHDRLLPDQRSHTMDRDAILMQMALCHAERSGFRGNTEILEGLKRARSEMKYTRFLTLMRNLRKCSASDPHDKVYGVLGVAADVNEQAIPINYDEPFRDTYAFVTKEFIQLYSDLTVLSLVDIEPFKDPPTQGPRLLPSWVPDYRFDVSDSNNKRLHHGPKVVYHGSERFYKSTGSSKASIIQEDKLRLTLQGVRVGRIAYLSDPAGNFTGNVTIGPNVCSGGQWSRIAHSRAATQGIYSPTNEPIDLAFARLRTEDRLVDETIAARRKTRIKQPILEPPEPVPSDISDAVDREIRVDKNDHVTHRVLISTTRQRLYVTDTGYMGMAHQGCVIGDMIYLLMGGDMPFVVRPLATGTYEFKGESYVHGVMDGEFLLKRFFDKVGDLLNSEAEEWLNKLGEGPLSFSTENIVLT